MPLSLLVCRTVVLSLFLFILLFSGEGQFGKVYCAVNMDTGELMAMKEVRLYFNVEKPFL